MSTINGFVKNGQKVPAPFSPVTFTLVNTPVIDGQALIGKDPVATRTDSVGFFAVVLSMGDWWMESIAGKLMVSVPSDDNTYAFHTRVVSAAVFAPSLPPGGADPNAAPATLGLVRTNGYAPTPVVYLKDEVDALIAGVGGGGGGGGPTIYNTLAALKAAAPADGAVAILTGLLAADDLMASEGRVRWYLFRSGSSLSANDGAVVARTSGGGRWIQI